MMARREWTNHESETLARGWTEGIPTRDLAEMLPGRSESSVRCRARWAKLVRGNPIAARWTEEEDEILRRMWKSKGSLKSKVGILPGRTWRSLLERGRKLGLTRRGGKNHSTGYSRIRNDIEDAIRKFGPMTARELSEIVEADQKYIGMLMRAGVGEKYYVTEWTRPRQSGSGSHAPRFAIGKRPNAPKPAIKSDAQCKRDWVRRQQVKAGRFNPFATLAMQVAA